jgi:hypothetical protein
VSEWHLQLVAALVDEQLRRSEVVKGVLRGATQRALVRAEHH